MNLKNFARERMRTDLTRANAVSEEKIIKKNLKFQICCVNKIKKKKSVRRQNKKHSRKNSGSDSKRQNIKKNRKCSRCHYLLN